MYLNSFLVSGSTARIFDFEESTSQISSLTNTRCVPGRAGIVCL